MLNISCNNAAAGAASLRCPDPNRHNDAMSRITPLPLRATASDGAVDGSSDIEHQYLYWRVRILATTIVGYALYYFVRANINVPLKSMGADLGYSKGQLGLITTIGGVTYGISKFINGFFGDHANPRYFMAIGLLLCAVTNVFFGASSSLVMLGLFWFFNNYFQGMGFPPCAKSMAYWFSPKERATVFGIWHSSHMIGAALVGALTGYLVKYLGWRWCFYIPAGIAGAGAAVVFIFLRDTPESLGLPPVERYKNEQAPADVPVQRPPQEPYWDVVIEYIFKNPYMWVISFANLSVYVLRYAQLTWGPTFLQESKGFSVIASGWLSFGAEMGGMVGALIGGVVTDRVFNGRAGRVCVIAMALMTAVTYLFWKSPTGAGFIAGTLFILMGFLLYVPQMLIAAMAMNLATQRASAAAVGLTGIIGYASTLITGWGIGSLVDQHGWPSAFKLMIGCAVITLILMAITWNVGAHAEAPRASVH
jgi:OPA family glycerol-3-phosphate transporter-like MFS transporter/OPA family sugar phosphate sensor protein UhpC-like MFS transporter